MAALEIKLKSLIMAQIERWRQASDMQVERKQAAVIPSGGTWCCRAADG